MIQFFCDESAEAGMRGAFVGLGRLYASEGRPSIPPEQLLSALLLQVFYGIRSERQLMELTFCTSASIKSLCNINIFTALPMRSPGKFCSRFCSPMFAFGCY
jgi:Transposase domain (DUF772)